MDALTLVLFVIGIGLLIAGAELLVRGASSLALAVGISPLVVGLTVVAFGTSSPEMAVSISAASSGKTDIAVGNVVGSNIFNVLFILGVCGLVSALVIAWRLVRLEVPIMIAVSVLLWVLVLDGELARWEATLLFAGMVGYTVWVIRASRKETAAAQAAAAPGAGPEETPKPWYVNIGLIGVGLVLLVVGSNWLVDGAVDIADELGLSELVIGLTIVAAGTSLPEVATSVMATIRGQREIAVGNVVGSNIFNILGVLGLSGMFAKSPLEAGEFVRNVDLPVMIGVAAICLPVFYSGRNLLHRWEGGLFLSAYVLYVTYLVWSSSDDGAASWYVNGTRFVLVPLAVALVLSTAWIDKHKEIPEAALR